jgi:hypothetical protein
VNIDNCTPGDRCGRICCGEFGVGWAVLGISWSVDQDGNEVSSMHRNRKEFASSGACRFADLCDENIGENFITKTAKDTAPQYV